MDAHINSIRTTQMRHWSYPGPCMTRGGSEGSVLIQQGSGFSAGLLPLSAA